MSKKSATRSESQRKLWRVPLASITTSNNTRNPLSAGMQKSGATFDTLWKLAISDGAADRKLYVDAIDLHESGEGGIRELAASILMNSLANPIILRENRGGESFSIVAGARRALAVAYNACRGAGQAYIEASVNKDNNIENLYRGLAENQCRKNPNLMERARACQMAINGGSTTAEISEREGCSEQTIKNRLRLLELDPKHQKAVAEGRLTLTKALELLRVGAGGEECGTEDAGGSGSDFAKEGATSQASGGGKQRKHVRKFKEVRQRYDELIGEFADREHMDAANRREVELLEWFLKIEDDEAFK